MKISSFFSLLLIFFSISIGKTQILESAFSSYDNIFDEFKIHVNVDEYVEAVRQFGSNPYHRWNIRFINLSEDETIGFLQQKWEGNYNLWDFWYGNEFLTITTIYPGDPSTWKIQHDEKTFTIRAENSFGYEWKDRYHKSFDWLMYEVEEQDFRNWYIDDDSTDEITFPMRIAAALIVIETMTSR